MRVALRRRFADALVHLLLESHQTILPSVSTGIMYCLDLRATKVCGLD